MRKNISTWIGNLLSGIGVLITVYIWLSSIETKLDRISVTQHDLSRSIEQLHTLSFQQADALLTSYILTTRAELTVAVNNFFERELTDSDLHEGGRVDEFFEREALEIIRRSRVRLQVISLRDGTGFEKFLNDHNPIDSGIIKHATDSEADPKRFRNNCMSHFSALRESGPSSTKKVA